MLEVDLTLTSIRTLNSAGLSPPQLYAHATHEHRFASYTYKARPSLGRYWRNPVSQKGFRTYDTHDISTRLLERNSSRGRAG